MALSVNTNVSALTAQTRLGQSNDRLSVSLERLSTGFKINSARDSASGLVISELQRSQINGLDQAVENIDRSATLLQTAESGLGEINSLLLELRELAVDGANAVSHGGGTGGGSNAANQAEVDNLLDTITRIANTTKFGTVNVLDGSVSASTHVFQIGGFQGETASLNIASQTSNALGINGVNVEGFSNANAAIGAIDTAIASVSTARGSIGAFQANTLEATQSNLTSQVNNLIEAESIVRDTDFEAEITRFTNEQIRQQSAISVLGLANQGPQAILSLLG